MPSGAPQTWGRVVRLLHWLMALLIFVQIALGWLAKTWVLSPTKLDLFVWHKSLGVSLLLLIVIRIAWRVAQRAPALPVNLPSWERTAARGNQLLLYLLLLAMPISGWVINSAANIPFRIFWLVPLPDITAPDKALADDAKRWHLVLFITLAMLLVMHIGAALHHHFVRHNDILKGMLPGGRS